MFRPMRSSSGVKNYGWGNCCDSVSFLRLLIYRPLIAHACSRWWAVFLPVMLRVSFPNAELIHIKFQWNLLFPSALRGSRFLPNVCKYLPGYTVLHHTRQQPSQTLPFFFFFSCNYASRRYMQSFQRLGILGILLTFRKLLLVIGTSLSSVIPGIWSVHSSLCLFTKFQIGLIPHCSIITWFLTGSTLVFPRIFLESPDIASSGLRGVGV
jgi:hypothetical protein